MEKARYNTELYSNLRAPLNNVKSSNFWGSHHRFKPPCRFREPSAQPDFIYLATLNILALPALGALALKMSSLACIV